MSHSRSHENVSHMKTHGDGHWSGFISTDPIPINASSYPQHFGYVGIKELWTLGKRSLLKAEDLIILW